MLKILGEAWKENPSLRLGQLLVNATGHTGDFFYVEDARVRNSLYNFARIWFIDTEKK